MKYSDFKFSFRLTYFLQSNTPRPYLGQDGQGKTASHLPDRVCFNEWWIIFGGGGSEW